MPLVLESNKNTGASLQVPSAITDFRTVSYVGSVRVYFSTATGYPAPRYDLYEGNTLRATGITSGYQYSFSAGVKTLHVRAVNTAGTTSSNSATATSKSASGSKTYSVAGNYTFTAPVGYSKVTVCMIGGGGSGACDDNNSEIGGGYAGSIRDFNNI